MYCPNCGDKRKKIEWENNILNHFRCPVCGHVFHYRPLDKLKVELPNGDNSEGDAPAQVEEE